MNVNSQFSSYHLTTKPSPNSNSKMSTEMVVLCSVCTQVFQPTSGDSTSNRCITPQDQTFDSFRKAASGDCFICSKLWNLSELQRKGWETLSTQSWRPLSFKVDRDYYKGKLDQIRVNIIYRDPTSIHSDRITNFQIKMITSSESEYEDLFLFDKIEGSTGSARTLELAHSWFQACSLGHDQCKRLPTSVLHWLPTRLVDIGSKGETTWKLVITSDDLDPSYCQFSPRYLTLSYRWGIEPQKLLLSTHNLELLCRGSPIVELPRTFQDLVVVAHHLGIRYLWIDSLCIIQNCRSDWEKEALTMRDVYANAACNIAASASSSPSGGLFRSRLARDIRPGIVTSKLAPQESRKFYMFDKGYWDRHLQDGALHSRGWVFQERFLSPRQIYFTKSQVMWECLEEHRCEGFPRGVPLHKSSKSIKRLLSSQEKDDKLKTNGLMSFDALDLWIDIVTTYSQCQSTVIEDKLYALGGIAKLFRQVTGDTYLAGLWRSRLLYQLDWYAWMPKSRITSKYRAPSWSWASIDGPVQPTSPGHGNHFLAEVIDASVTTTNEGEDMVNITGGSITLRAKVYSTTFKRTSSSTGNGCIHFVPTDKMFPPFTTWPYFDAVEDSLNKTGETSLLPLRNQEITWRDLERGRSDKANDVTCLILKKSGDLGNSYRRIGWLKLRGERGYDKKSQDVIHAILSAHESDQGLTQITMI
ncbi:heterokaryon incompatibility protein-domain-containing protein [Colletotrichum godetiae]|uniref:Heterokaryon incompatibility protein-domain-containing protein n=1 Tax=Colletotrichum godetiae TaxID=1209918 RepID=A0AAJ0AB67_9PEZI|nr:heterokaryon incompatibility protein-domain-containing protein [Colletotrichum godetiae]KAK1659931.1 heterokaryon incompatibility protein-domain-containing protein [Colletotrichum godetiae]